MELIIIAALVMALAIGLARVMRVASPPPPLPIVTIYSASDTAGGYGIPPDPALHTYDPSPAEMISLLGPLQVDSRSINGLKLSELLAGGPVALGVPGIGEAGCTVEPLDLQLRSDPAQIVVMGAGMVDCFFTNCSLDDYMTMVRGAVASIKVHGKTPVIRGYNRFAQTELMTAEVLQRRAQFNAALQSYCQETGVEFLDISSVPFAGLPDLAPDQIHPTAEYHQRIAAYMAQRLKEIAGV